MLKITVTGVTALARRLDREFGDFVQEVGRETYQIAGQSTPVRSGFARRNWRYATTGVGNKDFQITNRTPYIGRLEDGASKQAPRGITRPTIKHIKGRFR